MSTAQPSGGTGLPKYDVLLEHAGKTYTDFSRYGDASTATGRATNLTTALAAAVSGDVVRCAPGTRTFSSSVTFPAGVTVIGPGWGSKWESSVTSGTSYCFGVATGAVLRNIYLGGISAGVPAQYIMQEASADIEAWLDRVKMTGESDCLFSWNNNVIWHLDDCDLQSSFDCFTCLKDTPLTYAYINNTHMRTYGDNATTNDAGEPGSPGVNHSVTCINNVCAQIRMTGGSLLAKGRAGGASTLNARCVVVALTGDTALVELSGVKMSSTLGITNYDADNLSATGKIIADSCIGTNTDRTLKAHGTVVYETAVGKALEVATNAAAARTATGAAASTITISTTSPLSGGGDLTANRTLTIDAATSSVAGSMSATDKGKLDSVIWFGGIQLTGASYVNPRIVAPSAAAQTAYTVPNNKKFVILGLSYYQSSGTTASYSTGIQLSAQLGTDYRLHADASAATATLANTSLSIGSAFIYEAGDLVRFTTNKAGGLVVFRGILFDSTNAIRSTRSGFPLTTSGAAETVLVQCTSGKTGFIYDGAFQLGGNVVGTVNVINQSGGSKNYTVNVPVGGTTTAAANLISPATALGDVTRANYGVSLSLGSLDSIVLTTSGSGTQVAFVNYIETP